MFSEIMIFFISYTTTAIQNEAVIMNATLHTLKDGHA